MSPSSTAAPPSPQIHPTIPVLSIDTRRIREPIAERLLDGLPGDIRTLRAHQEARERNEKTLISCTNERKEIRIGTRDSALAVWQAKSVCYELEKIHHEHAFQIVPMKTLGDVMLTIPLTAFSSKGVFTKELDVALLHGHIDMAVHCMKDLPTTLPDGIQFGATVQRGEVADAVILHKKHVHAGIQRIEELPNGSVIGTSALRRRATLAKFFPSFRFEDVRGNIGSRMEKLDNKGIYDAIILAAIGLERLGVEHPEQYSARIAHRLEVEKFGYAVGQGALAILIREGDDYIKTLLTSLEHIPTRYECEAERSLLKTLEGGCKVPIAVRTQFDSENVTLTLQASVLSVDGKEEVKADGSVLLSDTDIEVNATSAYELGKNVALRMLDQGAGKILQAIFAAAETAPDPQSRPHYNSAVIKTSDSVL